MLLNKGGKFMEQTKKSFKFLNALYLLLLLPLVFLFTACGESPTTKQLSTEATCSTSGDYAASSQEEYNQVIGEQKSIQADGYRLTAKFSAKTLKDEQEIKADAMYLNAIIKGDLKNSESNVEMAVQMKSDPKAVMDAFGDMFAGMGDQSDGTEDEADLTPQDVTVFYKDGKLYGVGKNGEKQFVKIDAKNSFSAIMGGNEASVGFDMSSFFTFTSVEDVLNMINKVDGLTVTRIEGTNNFKLVAESGFVVGGQAVGAGATLYVNCDSEGNVVAVNIVYGLDLKGIMVEIAKAFIPTVDSEGNPLPQEQINAMMEALTAEIPDITLECEFTMSGYNGNISYPNLSQYTEYTPSVDAGDEVMA